MKKIYNIILLTYLLCSCSKSSNFISQTLFTDNDERLLNYYAVNEHDKQLSWGEEFDNNDSEWPFRTGQYSNAIAKIENGAFVLDYWTDKVSGMNIPEIMDETKNFEIEMKLTIYKDRWFSEFSDNVGSVYYYLYHDADNKEIVFLKIVGEDPTSLYRCKADNYLQIDKFNVITVRKISDKYAIFINYKLFYILSIKDFTAVRSFLLWDYGMNVFDYVRVHYLP